jgi:hypothetical protein
LIHCPSDNTASNSIRGNITGFMFIDVQIGDLGIRTPRSNAGGVQAVQWSLPA